MKKHIGLAIVIIFSIALATLQQRPILGQPDDYRYVYVTEDGWKCVLTEATDECFPINSVGGSR